MVGFKEQEMSKFYQEMTVLLKQQKEDVDSAVINHGPYHLAPKFAQLEVSQDDWTNDLVIMTQMNRQYRDNTTGEMKSKEGNMNFHLNVHCIRRK